MKKGKILSIALGLAVIAPVLAFAQTDTNSARELAPIKAIQDIRENNRRDTVEKAKNVREELKQDVKDVRDQVKERAENIRERAKDEVENVRENLKEVKDEAKDKMESIREEIKISVKQLAPEEFKAFREKREEIKNEFEAKREEFKKEFESKREEVKQEIETKRAEFKDKIKDIKDEAKKTAAEKLFNDLNSLNSKMVDNLKKAADQIEAVLNRILSRSEKAAANGEDVTTVNAASDLAKKAIEDARTAIQTQAGKVYSTTFTSTSASDKDTLRADLTLTRNQLKQDLESVKTKVKAARDAVHNAATTLAQIPKVDELEISTSTTSVGTSTVSQ